MVAGDLPKREVCLGSLLEQEAKGATKSHNVYYRVRWSSLPTFDGHGGE
jgi:hypothetical protein